MKFRTILLFGAPGAGKGTQGKILGSIPNFFHMACGEVFRNLSIDSPLGRTFVQYSSQGQLVPDEYTIRLWNDNIQANIAFKKRGDRRLKFINCGPDDGCAHLRYRNRGQFFTQKVIFQ